MPTATRTPLTRSILDNAREHAFGANHSRIIVWSEEYGGGYVDHDDTPENRQRFKGSIVAEVTWDGDVEKTAPRKPRKPK
jgi:hypothetical protein